MLGIAAFRGVLAPVFDLRFLLGHSHGPTPRWVVLTGTPDPVALAFDLFEAQLRVPRADVFSETPELERLRPRHVRGAVRTADVVRPLIHIASVIETVTRRVCSVSASKEQ
jgi:chemotaxis signal transduction protein